ncbi:hypothetical protein MSPP1_000778 [Malassezia sp. CBS 17886]|nr:hypothetical protein MSPP1_000778 [Malassezia sp. CBS 17886]
MVKYLIGRVADPVFGAATGALAYMMWERDARNAAERPDGKRLRDLIGRRLGWEAPAAGRGAAAEAPGAPALRAAVDARAPAHAPAHAAPPKRLI